MTAIILISIYGLSVFGMWRYLKIAYSTGGRWYNIYPDGMDIVVTFFPILNTIGVIIFSFFISPRKVNKKPINLSKFFNVKK